MNDLQGVDAPEVIIKQLLHYLELGIMAELHNPLIFRKDDAQYLSNKVMNKARIYLQIPTKTIQEEYEIQKT
jgi:hypothetical protein